MYLYARISPISDKYVVVFVDCYSRRCVELAVALSGRTEAEPVCSLAVEHSHAMIVEVGDEDVVDGVDGAEVRSGKMSLVATTRSELVEQFTIGLVDENAARLVVNYYDVTLLVNTDPLRTEQLPRSDLAQVLSLWIEDAHPFVVVVGNEVVAEGADRDPGGALQLTWLSTASPKAQSTFAGTGEYLDALVVAVGNHDVVAFRGDPLWVEKFPFAATFEPDGNEEVVVYRVGAPPIGALGTRAVRPRVALLFDGGGHRRRRRRRSPCNAPRSLEAVALPLSLDSKWRAFDGLSVQTDLQDVRSRISNEISEFVGSVVIVRYVRSERLAPSPSADAFV